MDITQYKIVYQIFNLFQRSRLKHNLEHYRKYGLKKRYFSSISSEDFRGLESITKVHNVENLETETSKSKDFQSLEKPLQNSLVEWSKNGYVILNNFFTEQKVDDCNGEVDSLLQNKTLKFEYSNKIMFAFKRSKALKDLAMDDKLIKVLRILLAKEVELFQSINFLQGSQQSTHSDSIHMTTFPYGNLIAVWVALEDITEESGPLHYYPGSHRLPYVMNKDFDNVGTKHKLGSKSYTDYEEHIESIVNHKKLKKEVFLAKKGDVFIWHANLLHGGEKVLDSGSTRKSMVLHYYGNDCICFHEVTQRPTLKPGRM